VNVVDSNGIVLLSAGLFAPKKTDHPAARKHRYLNYGLLTLGTILKMEGHSVEVLHGGFQDPTELAMYASAENARRRVPSMLMLSLPSFLSIDWAREFLECFKSRCPGCKVVVGGRWVVGNHGGWIRSQLPGIDLVVFGTADRRIKSIASQRGWNAIPGTDVGLPGTEETVSDFVQLDYALDRDFPDFHPSIEVSRGCGMGCNFCEEKSAPLGPLRSPDDLLRAVDAAFHVYGDTDIHFYLEASFFVAAESWAMRLADITRTLGTQFRWRCETRVDSVKARTLQYLAESGLRVIDLGLESASPSQLRRMQKARDPEAYLKKASCLLKECKKQGIWTKVNVLLFPGETESTLAETADWLQDHRECIKGVSVAPLTVYGHSAGSEEYLRVISQHGAVAVDTGSMKARGITHVHLSPGMDYAASLLHSRRLSRAFMSARDYYDLKSFSYLARSYAYSEFEKDVELTDSDLLPFDCSSIMRARISSNGVVNEPTSSSARGRETHGNAVTATASSNAVFQ
jgi:radical SAM superfamily enzyme YgiQ (UPF0313 family)